MERKAWFNLNPEGARVQKSIYWVGDHLTTPLGTGSANNFREVLAGRTGIKRLHDPKLSDHPQMLARIDEERSAITLDAKYTRLENLVIAHLDQLIDLYDIPLDSRTLVVLSSTKGNIDLLHNPEFKGLFPEKRVLLSEMAAQIQNYLGLKSPVIVVSNACISGLLALDISKKMLQNQYSRAIVIGADELSRFIISGFRSFQALSAEICRPFDRERDGLNLGEAIASVYLSTDDKDALARIGGTGTFNDANHISGPSRTGEGLYLSIKKAKESTLSPPDFISAHGTATVYNDEMESIALSRHKLEKVPTHSLKGYFGHTLGTSGLLESVLGVHSMLNNELIPSLGFTECGTSKPLNIIKSRENTQIQSFLKLASGFGGCNMAAFFEKIT